MSWRVLKFGGTSVTAAPLAAAGIVAAAARERRVAVVVSALAGVTDRLVALVGRARAGAADLDDDLAAIGELHRERARRLNGAAALCRSRFESELRSLRAALAEVRETGSPHAIARALAAGERLSAPLFAATLEAVAGRPVEVIDATELLVAAGSPEEAAPQLEATRQRSRRRLAGCLGPVVVPGFYAGAADGAPLLLGRGGSDTSATLLGAALAADRVEIWTDVDGAYDRDPRRFPEARLCPVLDFAAAEALARSGAKVLHAQAIAPARAAGTPIHLRNTFRPEAPGTVVGPREAVAVRKAA